MPLSINISPVQFRQADFVAKVKAQLAQRPTAGNQLIFEVTESLIIKDIENTVARMHELAEMGIRFSIDDFGTGYSSLAYLKRLPLHELKIDRSFIRDTPSDADDVAIVRLILSTARHLRLRVVAEGVETHEQAAFLTSEGCDLLQGYLLCRPMPVADWLANQPPAAHQS
jgi:EAL domain-containing protein (putative c-di-GMP-specific phosphodiesterase class I)